MTYQSFLQLNCLTCCVISKSTYRVFSLIWFTPTCSHEIHGRTKFFPWTDIRSFPLGRPGHRQFCLAPQPGKYLWFLRSGAYVVFEIGYRSIQWRRWRARKKGDLWFPRRIWRTSPIQIWWIHHYCCHSHRWQLVVLFCLVLWQICLLFPFSKYPRISVRFPVKQAILGWGDKQTDFGRAIFGIWAVINSFSALDLWSDYFRLCH